jgi:hypothetical protein
MALHDLLGLFKDVHDASILRINILRALCLENFEITFHLMELKPVLLGYFSILVQEQINVDSFIEIKSRVILINFLFFCVVLNSIDLEHQHVRWSTNPCLLNLFLTRLVSSEAICLTSP